MKTNKLLFAALFAATLCACNSSETFEYKYATAKFSYKTEGLTVYFYDESVNAFSYKWDFGDGRTSTQSSPVHTYSKAGSYIVKLIVTNIEGESKYEEVVEVKQNSSTTGTPSTNQDNEYCILNVTNKTKYNEVSFEVADYIIAYIPSNKTMQIDLYERWTTLQELHPEMDIEKEVLGKSVNVSAIFYELWEGYPTDVPSVSTRYVFRKGRKYKVTIDSTTHITVEADL